MCVCVCVCVCKCVCVRVCVCVRAPPTWSSANLLQKDIWTGFMGSSLARISSFFCSSSDASGTGNESISQHNLRVS